MTVYLDNFFRRNKNSRALYTPPGTFDSEKNGMFVEKKYKEMTSLTSIKNIPRKSTLTSKKFATSSKSILQLMDIWNGKMNTLKTIL